MTALSNTIVAGIDPGKTGALVLLYPDDSATVHRVPLQRLNGKEQPAWAAWALEWKLALAMATPDMAVIEAVGARPQQGSTSMFSFGRTLGFAEGILIGTAITSVHRPSPSSWKAKMGLSGADKNASREMVRRLLPKLAGEVARVKDDGVAEAALLALYGRKHL